MLDDGVERSRQRANRAYWRENVCHRLTLRSRFDGTREGAMMARENYVAKQQRIGERLTRAMAKAHMDRRELAALTGYSEAQILLWEHGRAKLYPTDLINLCHA